MLWQQLPTLPHVDAHARLAGDTIHGAPWMRRASARAEVSIVYLRVDTGELAWRFPDGAEWYAVTALDRAAAWSPLAVDARRAA